MSNFAPINFNPRLILDLWASRRGDVPRKDEGRGGADWGGICERFVFAEEKRTRSTTNKTYDFSQPT